MAKQTNPITWGTTQTFTKNFSSSAQTITLTGPTNAQGTVTYELLELGSSTGNFTLNGLTLTIKANTTADSYILSVIATAAGNSSYNSGTASSTISITINKINPTLSVTVATLNYTGSAQTLVSSASVTGGGTIYYGLGSSTTSAPSATGWSTTKPTATNVGSYYVWVKANASTNYKEVTQVYKGTAVIKPVMYLKFHANGGTITDSPHKYSDTQYFKLNNSIVQGCSTSNGTFSDIVYTINTSTTYLNVWNITSYNITRTGYSYSGTTAFNTAANGTGINVNQDNTAAGDTNPITTQRLNGGTQITANVTKTLYVNWKANTYTVTLNKNATDATAGTASVTATYNANMPSATMPTRPGYKFEGYYDTSATSGGTQYYTATGASARTWNKTAATTLYARWTSYYVTLRYNVNGGTVTTGTDATRWRASNGRLQRSTDSGATWADVTHNVYTYNVVGDGTTNMWNVDTPPILKTGYSIVGTAAWNTKADGTGIDLNQDYSTNSTTNAVTAYRLNGNKYLTSNITVDVYPKWVINSYTLTIDPNGGSWGGTTSTSTATQNYNTTKSIAAPTRAGYIFVGWAETGAGRLSKINQTDPAFDSSYGGVVVYNNSSNGAVTHTRQSSSAGTAYGSYEILINSSNNTTSPGNGGFYQSTTSAANQKYIHVFVAKIPTGYTVMNAQNATGDGRTIQWLTSRKGTGSYQVYAYQHNCGSTGTFSTFGHVYLETGSKPVSWQLAYSAMTNITNSFADTYTYGAGAGRLTALWAPIVPVHMNINGTWKTGPVWLNIGGTWKQALEGYINVNDTWKQFK